MQTMQREAERQREQARIGMRASRSLSAAREVGMEHEEVAEDMRSRQGETQRPRLWRGLTEKGYGVVRVNTRVQLSDLFWGH